MLRAWICIGLFLLVPLGVYWQTVFHEYGFRDDYAHLLEAEDAPEKLVQFTASYGRLVYGALLVASVRPLDDVADFQWLRLSALLLLVSLGLWWWRLLCKAGWSNPEAIAIGLAITLLPAAQVTIGWSIAWPVAATLLLSLAGFAAVEAALARRGGARFVAWTAGGALYALAALTYQPSALFAIAPLAALLLVRSDAASERSRWAVAHLATMFGSLAVAFLLIEAVFQLGVVRSSGVVELEPDPLAKLGWFVSRPLANAFALVVLRDFFGVGANVFWTGVAIVAGIVAIGGVYAGRGKPLDRVTWLFCLLVLPVAAQSVTLVAAVRSMGYRTLFPLAALVVVLFVYSLRSLRLSGRIGVRAEVIALTLSLAIAAVLAQRNSFTLIAEPQGREWTIVRNGVERMPLTKGLKVYVIRPRLQDRSTLRVFEDEFGSLSSNSDWSTIEMFKAALRLRFPNGLPAGASYTFSSGLAVPYAGAYDYVIDMRTLKLHRRN